MGSFGCYCALCSGPLGIYDIKLGSSKAKHLARRRKRVENKKRRLKGEVVVHEDSKEWRKAEKTEDELNGNDGDAEMKNVDGTGVEGGSGNEAEEEDLEGEWQDGGSDHGSEHENEADEDANTEDAPLFDDDPYYSGDFSDNFSQASELSVQRGFNMAEDAKNDTDSMFSYNEKQSYDPEKVSRKDVQWIDRSRALAINKSLEGVKLAFLSGRGRYEDYFDYRVRSAGLDPRDTEADTHPVYHAYEPERQVPAFPIHEACFKMLTKCLATETREKIDKDVLYAIMRQNRQDLARHLDLDYGPINGAEQFWDCVAGEEWSAMDPGGKPGIEEVVKSMLPARLFDQAAAPPLDLAHKVRNDPLTMLPYDVLHGIFAQLSLKDTLSLMKASWHVFESTRDPAFWRLMIRVHIMSFFWELKDFFKVNTFLDTFDWKGTFQWLDEITKGTFGMEGPFMAIANRRRIWNVCEQLAPLYFEKLYAEAYTEPDDAEAAAIMATAKTYQTAATMFPVPTETKTITTQFIRSWSEVKYRACDFDTYWTESYGHLVGISVNFGHEKRLFGSIEGVQGQSLHIAAGDWIKEIRVSVRQIHERGSEAKKNGESVDRNNPRGAGPSKIDGMVVFLQSGERKNVHRYDHDANKRSYAVLSGMHIIGLTGEIAANGGIASLSLLQAPDPSLPPSPNPPSYTASQKLLWSSKDESTWHPSTGGEPIWSHPNFRVSTFPTSTSPIEPSFLHPDLLCHEVLLFARDPGHYPTLNRISALQIPDEHSNKSIIGLVCSRPDTRWQPPGFPRKKDNYEEKIGSQGPVPAMLSERWQTVKEWDELDIWNNVKQWKEENMRHFDIDGKGGEIVAEVHVTKDRRSLKLVTNRGREGEFGEKSDGKEWERGKKAEEGELIVGVTACFGRLSGWSQSAKMWSHWGLTDLGVVLTDKEDEK